MAFIVSAPKNEGFEPLPEGVHIAVCYGLYDLGTHYSEKWEKSSRQVLICFEIPEERCEVAGEDLPRAISKKLTFSLHHKAALNKLLVAWRGRGFTAEEMTGFDLKNILGAACQLQVIHYERADGEIRHCVDSVMALPKGAIRPKPENNLQYFCFDDCGAIPDYTPEWVSDIIKESAEYKGRQAPLAASTDDDDPPPDLSDDSIPF